MMKIAATHLMLLLAATASACGGGSPAPDRSEPVLLGDDDSSDAVAMRLASSMRQLVDAIASRDSVTLGRLLTPHTKAVDLRPSRWAVDGNDPPELGYFGILAGSLSERVAPQYETYYAIPREDIATVYAIGTTDGLRTSWAFSGTQWRASYIVILGAADAQHNLERERARTE